MPSAAADCDDESISEIEGAPSKLRLGGDFPFVTWLRGQVHPP